MDGIRETAAVFCAVAVMSAALGILSGGALEKCMGYILSLILLTSVVMAIGSADFKFSLQRNESKINDSEESLAVSEYQAEYLTQSILTEKGIEFNEVTAKATKNDDGGIIISEIRIKGVTPSEEITDMITESGITETVIFE